MGCRRSWQGGERAARLNKALSALGCCRGFNGQRYVIHMCCGHQGIRIATTQGNTTIHRVDRRGVLINFNSLE